MIATFTIPKVLQAQQDSRDVAIAKEAVGAVSEAFSRYKNTNGLTANTWFPDITPYFNYIKVDTVSVVDDSPTGTTRDCSSYACMRLHNGAVIQYDQDKFGGTTSNNALYFMVDPDGKSGSANKSIYFLIYANGKVRTWGTMEDPTVTQSHTYHPNPADDPPWFNWS